MRSLAQLRLSLLAILRRTGIISSAHALSAPRPAIVADTGDATNGALQFVTYIGTRAARFGAPSASVNWPTLLGSTTGNPVVIQATGDGTDANVSISIQPTGSGVVNTLGLLSVVRADGAGVTDVIRATKTNSGGAGQNGDGASVTLASESSTGTDLDAVSLDGVLTDAAVASATSALVVRTRFDGSALGEALRVTRTATTITQAAGSPNTTPGPAFRVIGGAHLGNIATVEASDVAFDLGQTKTWATGPIVTQRAVRITPPTYAFVGASTITNAATVCISGAPIAGGNATITNQYALWITGDRARFDGPVVQNSYPVLQNTGTDAAPSGIVNTPSGIVAVLSGFTSTVVTCANCTADTHIHAVIRNVTTNPTQIAAVIPNFPVGGQFTVSLTADPGASGAIIGVLIHQGGSGT